MRSGKCIGRGAVRFRLHMTAGEVLHADVLMMPDGRSKGCGVVEYATSSDAQRAISELSNQTLSGRMVYIREVGKDCLPSMDKSDMTQDREQDKGFASGRGGHGGAPRGGFSGGGYQERSHHGGVGGYQASSSAVIGQITQPQLYITNLPFTVGWQDLKDLFRNAGSIVRADVHMGFDGRSKGSGVVLFESTADAQNAFKQFQGYDWQGRMLDIKEDRYASSGRGGRGGFQERGGFGGARGGFSSRGGFQSRGGYGGGYEGGYDSYSAPPPAVEPNPFTDDAWANGEPSATIFVKNLPWSTSNDDLVELFSTIGKVERAEICYEPSGRSKGSGVVQFDAQETASIAIQKFTGYPYGGRPLGLSFVRYGEAPAPAGPYNGAGQPQDYPQGPAQEQQAPAYGFNGGDQEMNMDPHLA